MTERQGAPPSREVRIPMMQRVCVFCGSSPGRQASYLAAARALGTLLARRGLGLVYGGASIGLMGAVADAALAAGGEVIGVIPAALASRELLLTWTQLGIHR